MKRVFLLSVVSFLLGARMVEANEKQWPADGFVPDAPTAIRIATAVWTPIYGKENIDHQKPYIATLENDQWSVHGSMPDLSAIGGVAYATISKSDGKILKVYHTQ